MNDYITMLNKHKINGGFLAPDYIPFEERNKNEMLLELQNEIHTKDKEIERLNNIINKAIEILDIYGTSNYETADLLYSTLRGSDKE